MKKGFSMVEILVSLVIVSILAAIMFAGYGKAKLKGEKYQAIIALRAIRTAEKMYYGKWKTYVALADTSAIQSSLDVESQVRGAAFNVAAGATTFSVAMTDSAGKTLTLNESGTWGGTNTPLPKD
ncbi:MAG: type II secretion system protein [Candidatus Omnitrophota bacterium]